MSVDLLEYKLKPKGVDMEKDMKVGDRRTGLEMCKPRFIKFSKFSSKPMNPKVVKEIKGILTGNQG